MIEDEVQRVMSNPDHVIMSDDLALALADVEETSGEYLSLDENTFVCELQQAKRHTKTSVRKLAVTAPCRRPTCRSAWQSRLATTYHFIQK